MKVDAALKRLIIAMTGAVTLIAGSPSARAQQAAEPDIDALIDGSSDPAAAMALARGQADRGDLTGAAATLERTLLNNPKSRSASLPLYYISILCRLDDHQRATVELARLGGLDIDDADWSATQAACGTIQRPAAAQARNRDSITGQVTAGLAYDSNALGALSTQFILPGVPTARDDGFSFTGSARIDARAPLSANGYLYFGVSGLTNDNIAGPQLDYQLINVRLGYGIETDGFAVSFGPVGHFARLQGKDFYAEYGSQAEIAVPTGDNARVALHGEVVHQDYAGSLPLLDRDGTRIDAAIDYQAQPRSGLIYVVGGAFEHKTARTTDAGLGYSGGRIYAAAQVPLTAGGTYAGLSATVRHIDFTDALFAPDRVETRYFARAAIGTPLWGSGPGIEVAASYTRRDYGKASLLRDYDSVGAELRLIWNFGK